VGEVSEQDLVAVISQFDSSDWRELHVKRADFELFLSKDPVPAGWAASAAFPQLEVPGARPAAAPAPTLPPSASAAGAPAAARPAGVAGNVPAGWAVIRAPNLGTFYRAPKPGAPMFTDVGGTVRAGAELCLIEVMKLFTSVRTETAGIVREVYPKDGDLVEFDQPLFLIEPGHG
jgi:acetyl-CoA carboxylase biotin carboxyl carrier protein